MKQAEDSFPSIDRHRVYSKICLAISIIFMVTALIFLAGVTRSNKLETIEVRAPRYMHGDIITNSVNMELVYIPSGEFIMGSRQTEKNKGSHEVPFHRVKISKPFYMGRFEVTQDQYRVIMNNNPSYFKGANLPVEMVSWHDAVAFCHKLSQREGKIYRLPTEAEWEYACRAGTRTRFCYGYYVGYSRLAEYAWYLSHQVSHTTHPVGQKQPNFFGLYDMHGNVWEWCSDWYGSYTDDLCVDPQGAACGSARILRGGSWADQPRFCASAFRVGLPHDFRSFSIGFRVVSDYQN